jgi:hypothetical protein
VAWDRRNLCVDAQIFEQEARTDAGALENQRETAARMSASANEIAPVRIFEPIVGTQKQHLVERVRVRCSAVYLDR